MKPLPGPKFLKSKVFENKFFQVVTETFLRPKFLRPIPRLFLRPKFSRPMPRLFFQTKYFRDRYRDFFSRLNIFETDTKTFFSRLNIFETDTETFFRDQNFRDQDRYSQKIEKSLDTKKSRDEMSHSAYLYTKLSKSRLSDPFFWRFLVISELGSRIYIVKSAILIF